MQRVDVRCPAAPWENTTTDADRALDLCYDLSVEFGYARIHERVNGTIIAAYTDGQATWRHWHKGALLLPLPCRL